MKIVVLDGYTLNPGDLSWDDLEKLGDVTLYDHTENEDIKKRIGDAEIVFTNKTPITKDIIENSKIKWIGVLATGYNVVDTQAASEKNIPVCNVPTYGTRAVSQFVFALLLEICHHVQKHSDAVKEGRWESSRDFCFWDFPLVELSGKTMGIIGLGRIGFQTSVIARAFGMKVLAYDGYKNPDYIADDLRYVSKEDLYKQSDVISLHCPLFEDTKGMINKETLSMMKETAILINTSRGPLVVEEDLRAALNADKLLGYACDVVSTEPIQGDNPLLGAKNCLITPHIAWAPKESRKRLLDVAVNNLSSFLDGKVMNAVNIN